MNCKICSQRSEAVFNELILGKYQVRYFFCKDCGFVFTEEPYWLEESYRSPINISDTGIMDRNLLYSKLISVLIYFFFNKDAEFLDYAGGYGIFTRLMRDIGFDFYWSDAFSENLVARGFEYNPESNGNIQMITALEVFEHFSNPLTEIKKMRCITDNIAFTTTLLPIPVPKPSEWEYYAFEHGQHVSFYSSNALKTISIMLGLNYLNYGNFHLFTPKKINDKLFKLLMFLSRKGLFEFIKTSIKTRTVEDNFILRRKKIQ